VSEHSYCETCSHWDLEEVEWQDGRYCKAITGYSSPPDNFGSNGKAVITARASLITTADFGCHLWEQRR
jgi:hypothetical protein